MSEQTHRVRAQGACRLVPSRYPTAGIFDQVATPDDLAAIFELESWTNDRISAEAGLVHRIPREEWTTGEPMSSVVMAAFCHPRPGGGRFNTAERGAWYASRALATAHAECIYHRGRELQETGISDARLQMRLYLSDFDSEFVDVRERPANDPIYDPVDYGASQRFAAEVLARGSAGIVYRSVRHSGGECIACFRPRLVRNVRQDAHFEYRWQGRGEPVIIRLTDPIIKPRRIKR